MVAGVNPPPCKTRSVSSPWATPSSCSSASATDRDRAAGMWRATVAHNLTNQAKRSGRGLAACDVAGVASASPATVRATSTPRLLTAGATSTAPGSSSSRATSSANSWCVVTACSHVPVAASSPPPCAQPSRASDRPANRANRRKCLRWAATRHHCDDCLLSSTAAGARHAINCASHASACDPSPTSITRRSVDCDAWHRKRTDATPTPTHLYGFRAVATLRQGGQRCSQPRAMSVPHS